MYLSSIDAWIVDNGSTVVLNKVLDRMCCFVLIMGGRTASITLENSNSKSRFFAIKYPNTESTLIVFVLKNIAFLIKLDSFI